MSNKLKSVIVTLVFVAFLATFVGMCVFSYFNQVETSEAERRPLAQFPKDINWENILNKKVMENVEVKYKVSTLTESWIQKMVTNKRQNTLGPWGKFSYGLVYQRLKQGHISRVR